MNFADYVAWNPTIILDLPLYEASYKDLMQLVKTADSRPHKGVVDRAKERAPIKFVGLDKTGLSYWTAKALTTEERDRWDQQVQLINWPAVIKREGEMPLQKLVQEALKGDIKVKCDCPAFLYWGYKFILSQSDSLIGQKELRAPVVRNPALEGAVCVHVYDVLKVLPFHISTFAKIIKSKQWHVSE